MTCRPATTIFLVNAEKQIGQATLPRSYSCSRFCLPVLRDMSALLIKCPTEPRPGCGRSVLLASRRAGRRMEASGKQPPQEGTDDATHGEHVAR